MASLKTIHQTKRILKTILTFIAAALGVIQTRRVRPMNRLGPSKVR